LANFVHEGDLPDGVFAGEVNGAFYVTAARARAAGPGAVKLQKQQKNYQNALA
jgi:hypothetical protein